MMACKLSLRDSAILQEKVAPRACLPTPWLRKVVTLDVQHKTKYIES